MAIVFDEVVGQVEAPPTSAAASEGAEAVPRPGMRAAEAALRALRELTKREARLRAD